MNNIKNLADKTLEEIEKAKKEPYPLYYKQVFNSLVKHLEVNPKLLLEEDIDEEFLDKTKQTTEFIHSTNETIKNNSENLVQEIEVRNLNDDIKNLVKNFEGELLNKLTESNNKINELQDELNKVYNKLNMDSLTKAYSRNALENDLKHIVKIGEKRDLNIALVVFDLDHFKNINDTYGHLVGDFVLVKVIQFVKEIIRKDDKVYRFGGDEFVIVFDRINKRAIEIITEKIRKKIENTKLKYKDSLLSLTISMGVACHIKNDTIESWLHRADKALYDSKKFRNKVTILC